MILYAENPKESTKKTKQKQKTKQKKQKQKQKNPVRINNKFSKVPGYKINEQKSAVFLYAGNQQSEKEIKKTIPFTTTLKRMKYFGIHLPRRLKTCTM